MLIEKDKSALLVVDIQERLLPHIHEGRTVLENAIWLVGVAQRLGVPVAATEQYPRGIGRTHADLRALIAPSAIAEKLHFSCVAAGCLAGLPGAERPQVVLCGTESHVCVQQTAIDLKAQGKAVFVVADAVSSRKASDKELALSRMRAHGIDIVSREMVAFEWLHVAGSDLFRAVSWEFLR
jgi:nicotinamidase-related amidase